MWDSNDNHPLARLCGGWVPDDSAIMDSVKYVESLGAEVWADKSQFDRRKVTESSAFYVGSAFYIHFPHFSHTEFESWIWSCGQSYPKIDLWWQPRKGIKFEMSGEGLQQAIDWVLAQKNEARKLS